MRKLLLLPLFYIIVSFTSLSQDFITVWTVTQGQIAFDAVVTGNVAYTWQTLPPAAPASGSGTFTGGTVVISGLPNSSGTSPQIQLSIAPQNFKRFTYIPSFFGLRIDEIKQWGSVEWISMEDAFANVGNGTPLLVSATDVPNLANAMSLADMFGNSGLFGPFNLNSWDVSNIVDMSRMFIGNTGFNESMSAWNTTNVVNMSRMFEGC